MGQAPATTPVQRRVEDVCRVNRHIPPLGQGTFGTVWRANLVNGTQVAVKELDKRRMFSLEFPLEFIRTEVDLMQQCKGNDRFVQLIDFIETHFIFYIVLELCDGNLEEAANQCEGKLVEKQAVNLMRQLLQGICFLHSKNICHRDIKPLNIMMVGHAYQSNVRLKIGDFGLASKLVPGEILTHKLGTPAFMAPELHLLPDTEQDVQASAGYDFKVDMWAAGVVMVFVLSLEYPFVDGSGNVLRDRILRGGTPLWNMDDFSGLFQRVQEVTGMRRKRPSRAGQDLIRQLLSPRRHVRPSARRALQHAWFLPSTDLNDIGDDLPLLAWTDFRESVAGIDRAVSRVSVVAAGVATAAAADVALEVTRVRDRVASDFSGFTENASKALVDVTANTAEVAANLPQTVVDIGSRVNKHMTVAAADANVAANEVAHAVTHVEVDTGFRCLSFSADELSRREVCYYCNTPAGPASHCCPACGCNVCFDCAKKELVQNPRCPHCGNADRNAAELEEFLACGAVIHPIATVCTCITSACQRLCEFSATYAQGALAASQKTQGGKTKASTLYEPMA
mmetsp:Transcript_71633/g.142173  ORF Transcript_71633/g.142173 Transcript_71633/m.142173 type:complete len:566 (+) Transcript_71633:102-1799(+)|eukprot:CAMPEP_0172926216 /NCGR_PEP_ID=MMETSP1075-20121228/215196_1 /TAXON_ID=2916 /ORGANISM="Ceratium fusus, Strain PA161109" /LENGTH=565 /DNA_ID=CAMNT_0013787245 /DNA_START=14 /DNA_END=1711 /DNA_ORIENTATION=-